MLLFHLTRSGKYKYFLKDQACNSNYCRCAEKEITNSWTLHSGGIEPIFRGSKMSWVSSGQLENPGTQSVNGRAWSLTRNRTCVDETLLVLCHYHPTIDDWVAVAPRRWSPVGRVVARWRGVAKCSTQLGKIKLIGIIFFAKLLLRVWTMSQWVGTYIYNFSSPVLRGKGGGHSSLWFLFNFYKKPTHVHINLLFFLKCQICISNHV